MSTRGLIFVTLVLNGMLLAAAVLVWRQQVAYLDGTSTAAPPRNAVQLSEAVRPGGGWFASATSRPVIPDTRFMGVPDEEEQRIDEPRSPLHGNVIFSRVMQTHISLYDSDKKFNRVKVEQQQGRLMYWAVESQDAYVFPDSTRQQPHTLLYTKVERFVAERFTDEEVQQERDADAKAVADALGQYRQADPALELRLALAQRDRRFVGIMSDALVVPGTSQSVGDLVDERGVKVIPHTDDAISGPDEREFQAVAHRFAEAYNRLLLNEEAD